MLNELRQPSTEPGADLRVAVHCRILQPFMDSTMLMLGLPLMFSRQEPQHLSVDWHLPDRSAGVYRLVRSHANRSVV